MITDELKAAFRWHLQNMPRYRHGFGEGLADAPRTVFALAMARRDVAAGITRYPAPIKPWPAFGAEHDGGKRCATESDGFGLRFVGRVMADCGGRNGIWDNRDSSGWYTSPYGESDMLCHGVVYQLPGRNGESRFVAGYQFTDCDGGPTLDLSRIYAEPRGFGYASAFETDAARDAAHAADSMAKAAAEAEREYQAAWQAGSRYSAESCDLKAIRQEVWGILAERRALKGTTGYPALCKATAARVRDLLDDMAERRDKMRELANGMFGDLAFHTGDKNLAAAFNEGAGESVLPC